MEGHVTIEKTKKCFKLARILIILLMVPSGFITLVGVLIPSYILMGFGIFLIICCFISLVINNILIWWNHA